MNPFHEGNLIGHGSGRDPVSLNGGYGSRKRSIEKGDPFSEGHRVGFPGVRRSKICLIGDIGLVEAPMLMGHRRRLGSPT
jgi:hypothetical protein